jgi:hypothetical protein
MHPDRQPPPDPRTTEPDGLAARRPEQDQDLPDDAETTRTNVQTPEPAGKRLGEAGSQYTGRQLDDRLKANPRVDDARDVQADDGDAGADRDTGTVRTHPDDPAEGARDAG